MKMSEFTTYCSPGNNWSICEAQKWNCAPDLIESIMAEAREIERDEWAIVKHYFTALKGRGLKYAAYCDSCGSKYDG